MDDLVLNDVGLILSADMDIDVSIETHKIWQTINFEEKSDRVAYLKFVQNIRTIFLKLETQELNSNKIKTWGLNMIFPIKLLKTQRKVV